MHDRYGRPFVPNIYGPNDPPPRPPPRRVSADDCDFDLSEVACPKCGSAFAVEIIKLPEEGKWFGGQGKAECTLCHITFRLSIDPST